MRGMNRLKRLELSVGKIEEEDVECFRLIMDSLQGLQDVKIVKRVGGNLGVLGILDVLGRC